MMNESEMEYRGSKSDFNNKFVKEQRVDGNWCIRQIYNPLHLRCTLMDCESSYQIKILSKKTYRKTQVKSFHTIRTFHNEVHNIQVIHPWYLTGFIDAEGSFLISIRKNKNLPSDKIGWNIELRFQISLHIKDIVLLEKFKGYFGVGFVNKEGENVVKYRVNSIKDLSNIINHLEKYPLITQKRSDYLIFKQVFNLI
jgi:hypothetical protein